MAYGIRYSCDWQSPMRDKRTYTIEILERDYEGEASPLYPRGDVLEITQGNVDDDELVALRGSEATLSLLCVDEGEPYLQLFTTDPMRYKLRVWVHDRARRINYWDGFLSTSAYAQVYAKPPYHVSLSAVDGLALLKDIPYLDENGNRYEGVESIDAIISKIMAKIDVTRVRYMPMLPVHPKQDAHTLEVLGVENKALYTTLGEELSCSTVLNALLQSLGLQIFQSYGASWRVRSVASLIDAQRQVINTLINNGDKPVPLFSDAADSKGMSTSATLSLLAPYKTLDVSRPTIVDAEDTLHSMLVAERWSVLGNSARHPYTWTNSDDFVRIVYGEYNLEGSQYYGCYYVADSKVIAGSNINIEVVMDAINISGVGGSMRVGLFLVDGGIEPDGWLEMDREAGLLLVGDATVYGVREDGAWGKVPTKADSRPNAGPSIASVFGSFSQSIDLSVARWIPEDVAWDTSNFPKTSVSVGGNGIPSVPGITSWHVVVMLLGPRGSVFPAIELRNPTIKLSQRQTSTPQVTFGKERISSNGLGTLRYDQHFGDTWLGLSSGSRLDAPLIDITTMSPMRTFVAPMQRSLLADTIVADMKALRNIPIRQLEGEVYSGYLIDLDARWVDRDGRRYYTNYIKHDVKRGIDYVQLRELPSPQNDAPQVAEVKLRWEPNSVVGLDTSAYIAVSSSRSVVRYDMLTGTLHDVISSVTGTYPLTLNTGQRCACVISFDGVYYTAIAYDTAGKELSRIERVNTLVGFSSQYYDVVIRSAAYDANTKMWSMVGGDDTVVYLYIIHGDGRVYARDIYSIGDYRNPSEMTLAPNGFFYRTAPPATSLFHTYWHNNAQHADADVVLWEEYKQMLAANETYFAIHFDVSVGIFARTDTFVGYDSTALYSEGDSWFEFVGMNNALALFRSKTSAEAKLYDGRTNKVHIVDFITPDAMLWLSGESVGAIIPDGASWKIVTKRYSAEMEQSIELINE